MTTEALRRAQDVTRNVFRLVDDAKLLNEHERYPSVFALAILALEEVGKAIAASLVEQRRDPGTGGDASLVCEKRLRLLPASVRRPRCQWPLSVK
jgi:hypothetical protein